MKESREERIQKAVTNTLTGWNIFPESVVCTFCIGDRSGLLAITLYISNDLDELLDHLDYKSQCDKSKYCILRGDNTLILTGSALINLYTTV